MQLVRPLLLLSLILATATPASAIDWDREADRSLVSWRSDRDLLDSLATSPSIDPGPGSSLRRALAGSSSAGPLENHEPGWRGWMPLVVSFGAWVLVESLAESPKNARWSHVNDFDDSLRDSLTASSRSGRENADAVSDWMLYGTIGLWAAERVYAGVQDLRHERARDPNLTGWEAFRLARGPLLEGIRTDGPWLLMSGVATSGTKSASGRVRPKTRDCLDLRDGTDCGGRSGNNSFFSGHTAFAGTLAGLTCRHRMQRLDRSATDVGICVVASSMAVTTGAMRVVGDEHWTTDVMAGTVVGVLFGWALPEALGPARRAEPAHLAPRLRLQPLLGPDRYGLGLSLRY